LLKTGWPLPKRRQESDGACVKISDICRKR
jgi:hypothetical protein